MTPKDVLRQFIDAFNRADVDALAMLYSEDAINHQVADLPVKGRDAIRQMFVASFAEAPMTCILENMFEDGEWAIMEWRDPAGPPRMRFLSHSKRTYCFSAGLLGQTNLFKAA